MPIQINFSPAAGVVAGAALLGGQGDYQRWLQDKLQNQYQFGVQSSLQAQAQQNDRLQAMQQAAIAQQQIAAQQQNQASQQNFEASMLPMRSALDAQNYAFQSNLQEGVQQRHTDQQFQNQSDLSQQAADQQAAQLAQQQQGQLYNQQAMASYSENEQAANLFQSDPLQEMKQNMQANQQQGYTGTMSDYSPDQQQRMQKAQTELNALQERVNTRQDTLPTLLPAIKQSLFTLRSISASPQNRPPPSLQEQFSKDVLWASQQDPSQPFATAPQPGYVPMQKSPKDGQWQVIRGWKPPEPGEVGEDGQIINAKTQGLMFKNSVQGEEWVSKQLANWAKAHEGQSILKQDEYQAGYSQEEARLREIVQQASPGMPVAGQRRAPPVPVAQPVVPGQPPAAGIPAQAASPQNPQAAPQQAPAQAPVQAQQPQQATPQYPHQQVQDIEKVPPIPPQEVPRLEQQLKQKPVNQWNLQDFELQAAIYQAKGIKLPTREEVMGRQNGNGQPLQRTVPDNSNATLQDAMKSLGIQPNRILGG